MNRIIQILLYISDMLVPFLILYVVAHGLLARRPVYDDFVKGAKDGFQTVLQIMPTLVGLMVDVYKRQVQTFIITSPTYDGVCSDVRGIAEVCHRHGIPLIVDQAHGAHFPFSDYFPEDAVSAGADVVIHSVHKTLPALTQTAILHIQGRLADRERIRHFLSVYQSSSPSYVLMASIDACVDLLERKGTELFRKHVKGLSAFRESCRDLKTQMCIRDRIRAERKRPFAWQCLRL